MAFDNKYLQGIPFEPGTDWITIGIKLRFNTVQPGSDLDFLRISRDAAGEYHLALSFEGGGTAGQFVLRNANKVPLFTSEAGVLSADTWYLFEIKFKKTNSSDVRLWLDGSLLHSATNKDLDFGGAEARVEIRTQQGGITPVPTSPRCTVRTAGWYVITDDESTSTVVEFVGFETGGPEEVDRHGASTFDTSPAPPSAKETYICQVIADTGADPDD